MRGMEIHSAWGKHSEGLRRGDRLFVWAAHNEELHLLGAIRVHRSGRNWAEGRSLYGPFRIVALGRKKWLLRFESPVSDRLTKGASITWQVRSRRRPTAETSRILENILKQSGQSAQREQERFLATEGKRRILKLTARERDPRVRAQALAFRVVSVRSAVSTSPNDTGRSQSIASRFITSRPSPPQGDTGWKPPWMTCSLFARTVTAPCIGFEIRATGRRFNAPVNSTDISEPVVPNDPSRRRSIESELWSVSGWATTASLRNWEPAGWAWSIALATKVWSVT